ncbi:MAG: prolipoprotein diacylglyceryl transferase [Acidobacteriia bacterium]|nr:prolipoprotein diacylglyceryl transferase [Terriglobia bacterium]
MFPKIFSIGSFFLPSYGVLVALGFLSALWLTAKMARQRQLDPEKVTNLGVYAALSGLAGAKLLMFLFDLNYYIKNPGEILSMATLQAGGVFYGGLIAALLVGFLYMRRQALPVSLTLDSFAPGLALGQAIGRLGCFAAGCCWGEACERGWAVVFRDPEAHRLVGVPLGVGLHPTQLYEAGSGIVIFALLYWLNRRRGRPGALIGAYLVLSSAARFLVEFFRAHDQPNPFAGPFSLTQWISVAFFLGGAWFWMGRFGIDRQGIVRE